MFYIWIYKMALCSGASLTQFEFSDFQNILSKKAIIQKMGLTKNIKSEIGIKQPASIGLV
jgi:hypothetical protein